MTEGRPKRKVTVRIARSWEEAEQLDREWWEQFTPFERVSMLWDMVVEGYALKGIHVQPRLLRTACRLQRRSPSKSVRKRRK